MASPFTEHETMSRSMTRTPVAGRWLGLAAGLALALGSAPALAADQSPNNPPGGFDPSNAYPPYYYMTTAQPVAVYQTVPVTAVPAQPVTAYPVTVYQTTPVTTVPAQPVIAYPVTVYQTAPVNPAPVYPPNTYPATVYTAAAVNPPSPNPQAALREMQIAQEHAVRAVGAPDLATVQGHLHAVVNCLAGPDSGTYNPSFPNPCAGMGAGAIADTNDTSRLPYERDALAHARGGLQTSDLGAAKQAAINAINTLRQASM
jgi:hypothetical protein